MRLVFSDPIILGTLILSFALLWRIFRVRRASASFSSLPKFWVAVSPFHPLGRTLPRIINVPGITAGKEFGWKDAYERIFGKVKSDIVLLQSLFPTTAPALLLADHTAAKAVLNGRVAFPKPDTIVRASQRGSFGPSLVFSEHDEWRKHRRIAGPCFTEKNNRLVWESSIDIILGYFNKWNRDGKGSIVKVENFMEVTQQIAYMVFATAGFGISVDWDWNQGQVPDGYTMPFMKALQLAAEDLFLRSAFPRWILLLFKRGRFSVRGSDEMEKYMMEMIEERKGSAILEDRSDILSSLIRAANEEKNSGNKEFSFVPRDLSGNIFIFLGAGHETTASTLGFAMALLAVYQEEQEETYKQIRSIVPEGRLPTYEDVPRLTRVLAIVYETLRLFSPVNFIVREAANDCSIPKSTGESLPVPKGTGLVAMIDSIHYSEKYWSDPFEFRPSRFLQEYNKDAFLPFSAGPRICIGRRFSEIEQIAVLSVIILHYKITVLDEPQYANETPAERKARVLQRHKVTLVRPVRVPVMFTPREGANVLD